MFINPIATLTRFKLRQCKLSTLHAVFHKVK